MILATAGSAVGLGNVWRFPYMTGQNGGAAFILIYIACVLVLGIPCMMNEFIIGRHGAANTGRAYGEMGTAKAWRLVGCMSVLTGFIITSYYAVVSGWCMQYIFASAFGELNGNPQYITQYFQEFSASPIRPVFWTVAILALTHFVIIHGVRSGIERASKMMMPTLFVLLVVVVIGSCMLPGAGKGVEFLLRPDFSKMDSSVFLAAMGQSFYSLSIGMGCICTFASYFSRKANLMKSAVNIVAIDSLIAILAGLMIFPAAFSVGINPDSGPSLIFITLPNVFHEAFGSMPVIGYVISVLFYMLLALAALTSTISMHEIGTSFLYEELHVSRRTGATIETVICSVIGIMCALSCGASDAFVFFGKSLLDCCDFFTAQILMPLGAFLTSVLLGWIVPRRLVHREFTNNGTVSRHVWRIYLFAVRFVCPICIIAVFLHQAGVI